MRLRGPARAPGPQAGGSDGAPRGRPEGPCAGGAQSTSSRCEGSRVAAREGCRRAPGEAVARAVYSAASQALPSASSAESGRSCISNARSASQKRLHSGWSGQGLHCQSISESSN